MKRREFIGNLSLALAAAWVGSRLFWPVMAKATGRPVSLAFLADAHLPDGNPGRAEARALARAVAEIRNLSPAPLLVLFAGDLAHDGHPSALALGQEILSDLTMPVLAVRGEGDRSPAQDSAGWRFFKDGRFFYTYQGVNLLGLDTVWQDGSHGPGFALGEAQQRWLSAILTRLEPSTPLMVLSHAPLTPIYPPWGQWTRDSGPLLDRLSCYENVLYVHGHVHHSGCASAIGKTVSGNTPPPLVGGGKSHACLGLNTISLPATSWPLPVAFTGTPRKLRPGLGPRGCGWALLQQGGHGPQFRQMLWQA